MKDEDREGWIKPEALEIIPLCVQADGSHEFELHLKEVHENECSATAEIWETSSWWEGDDGAAGKMVPVRIEEGFGYEIVADVMLKWDGCGHLWFDPKLGERPYEGDKEGRRYLHACGRDYWVRYSQMLLEAYDAMARRIPRYCEHTGGRIPPKYEGPRDDEWLRGVLGIEYEHFARALVQRFRLKLLQHELDTFISQYVEQTHTAGKHPPATWDPGRF